MLITDKNATPINPLRIVRNGIVVLLLGVLLYSFAYPAFVLRKDKNADPNVILCDAEKTFRGEFIANGKRFSGGDHQRDKYANSGKYSCYLWGTKETQYTLSHDLTQVQAGDIYEFSVWFYQDKGRSPVFMAASNEDANYYRGTDKIITTNKRGWSQLLFTDTIPANFKADQLNVYVYTTGSTDTYFDDLQIKKIIPDEVITTAAFQPKSIGLWLNEKQYDKIKQSRLRALDQGIIITNEDSWAKGKLEDEGQKKEADIRLKGDWLDHLKGNKWSFRVKLKDPQTFNRLVTFSVHTPTARYHTLEWLLHQFWERENVLTTRYDFLDLSLNDEPLGIYAYEEHFEKQLVESKSRREGPILKFSEDALWKLRLHQMETENYLNNETISDAARMRNAKIDAFKEKKTLKSPTLSNQYEIGKQLLYQFQNGTKEASEIFDVKLMANYLAITDLMGAYHTLIWHNMRFYYNPISSKLEPIGFDGFVAKPTPMPKLFAKETLRIEGDKDLKALLRIFEDEKMVRAYMEAIFRITDEKYLSGFIEEMRAPYNQRKKYIRSEFPDFDYDIDQILDRAKLVRQNYLPLADFTLQTKWVTNNKTTQIEIKNLSKLPILINGFGKQRLPNDKLLKPNESKLLTPPMGANQIFFEVPGMDSIFSNSLPINKKWHNFSPIQKLSRFKTMPPSDLYFIAGEKIVFKKGTFEVVKDIIIPTGHQVIFEPGCNLTFIGKTKFISQSPITMLGTEAAPINISSKDGLANGFTILKAGGKSKLSNVHFTRFNTLNYDGWMLTGAVTFYESDVDISNSSFNDGKCEDGLNIVYSNFNLENVTLDGAASDGFDADFCKGNIINCIFKNTMNDGVDVSGSKVLIEQTMFSNCGDKAVSVGEESNAYLKDVTIEKAVIGVASKDLSILNIESISLTNCNQGFTAYQKKPEFGSSMIVVDDYTAEDVKYLYKLGVGSKLQLGSRLIIGE